MTKKVITTDNTPDAIAPYSKAIQVGELVYTSGQIGINPKTGLIEADVQAQAKQVLENVKALLEAAGTNLDNVFKSTVFIKDMNEFELINEVYRQYFSAPYPARSCVEVARLPKDVRLEIEVIAFVK